MTAYADAVIRAPKALTEEEQTKLLKVTGERRAGFRDHIIFSLALGTGLREHEILALEVGDVFDENGSARRRIQLRVFKKCTDAPAAQEVILPATLRAKLEKFFIWKKRHGQELTPEAPLFISRNGNRLSARQARDIFRVWQERAGFERRLSFHSLRHASCTNLYRRTRDIRITQQFARHKSIISTAIYTHPSDDEMSRSVESLPC
jgi:site-specific recombinase XerC